MSYIYRRLDNDELVEVGFATCMTQDVTGCIVLPDGTQARRCVWLELASDQRPKDGQPVVPCSVKHTSTAMGFISSQIGEFEADRVKHGFSDVEFVLDKEGYTYSVVCGSEKTKQMYAKHLGYVDASSRNGSKMGPEEFEMARQKVLEKYPTKG